MRKLAAENPWVAAVLSWLIAVVAVSGIYSLWLVIRGEAIQLSFIRDAALIAVPFALFRAWRDSRRPK